MRTFTCANCGKQFQSDKFSKGRTPKYCSRECYATSPRSDESRMRQSAAKKGKHPWNIGVAMWEGKVHPRGMLGKPGPNKGRVFGEETRKKISESHIGLKYPSITNEKHWNWKGGITKQRDKIKNSGEYKAWRTAVFKRDDYTCQECKVRGGCLHAHHIKPFATHVDLRFTTSNGLTLCRDCHRKTPNYGGNMHTRTGAK